MLKRMIQSLSLAPEADRRVEARSARPPLKPLPEAALRHAYQPTTPLRGSTIGPMWRDPEAARAAPRRVW
jgi:hypothetical protein